MSYRPSAPLPIPSRTLARELESVARSENSKSSRDGSNSSHDHDWQPQWRQLTRPSTRSSGRQGSDIMFPMDLEVSSNSNSSSSRPGSVEPPFLYDALGTSYRPPDVARMSVCSHCGRQFSVSTPTPNCDSYTREGPALCPLCRQRQPWQQSTRQCEEDMFYASTSHLQHRSAGQYQKAYDKNNTRNDRQRTSASTAGHVFGRAFPSYNGPIPRQTRSISQPYPPADAWADVSLPPATFVAGAYRPQYQLPQLITQLQQRSTPASEVSRLSGDPYGMSSERPYTHHRRKQ